MSETELLPGIKMNVLLLTSIGGRRTGDSKLVKILRVLRDRKVLIVPGRSVLIEVLHQSNINEGKRREWVDPKYLFPVDPELDR